MRLPTVRVVHPSKIGQYRIINESDFNPKVHTLWTEEGAAEQLAELDRRNDEPVVTHEVSANGFWKVFRDGEVIRKGRGQDALASFLASLE